LLHDYGYKISKIATYPEDQIPMMVREIVSEKSVKTHAISDFKVAMMNFDQEYFFNNYQKNPLRKFFSKFLYR
jgi:MerR family transcriptional regulator, light-induced transcriptional regulator